MNKHYFRDGGGGFKRILNVKTCRTKASQVGNKRRNAVQSMTVESYLLIRKKKLDSYPKWTKKK